MWNFIHETSHGRAPGARREFKRLMTRLRRRDSRKMLRADMIDGHHPSYVPATFDVSPYDMEELSAPGLFQELQVYVVVTKKKNHRDRIEERLDVMTWLDGEAFAEGVAQDDPDFRDWKPVLGQRIVHDEFYGVAA